MHDFISCCRLRHTGKEVKTVAMSPLCYNFLRNLHIDNNTTLFQQQQFLNHTCYMIRFELDMHKNLIWTDSLNKPIILK